MVDKVYNICLNLLDKDDRGVITPSQFNLSATKAQNKIYSSYFGEYSIQDIKKKRGAISRGFANGEFLLREKLSKFIKYVTLTRGTEVSEYHKPSDLFVLEEGSVVNMSGRPVEEMQEHERVRASLVDVIDAGFPIYVDKGDRLKVYPADGIDEGTDGLSIAYLALPADVNWTYQVVGGVTVHNPDDSNFQDFDLHESELSELVSIILQDFGMFVKAPEVTQYAMRKEAEEQTEDNR